MEAHFLPKLSLTPAQELEEQIRIAVTAADADQAEGSRGVPLTEAMNLLRKMVDAAYGKQPKS